MNDEWRATSSSGSRSFRTLLAALLALLGTVLAAREFAQGEIEDIVQQTEKRRQEYVTSFRDLTAAETWVTEILNKNGMIDQQRTVVSDFYLYPSRFKTDVVTEYRITRAVEGKAAGNPTDQAMKLFRALARAKTLDQEEQVLRQQNFRHILGFIVDGLAVNAFWPVRSDAREDYSFALSGRDRLGQREFIV